MTETPILYITTKSGKVKSWEINVVKGPTSSKIVAITGFVGGKMTEYSSEITEGKNLYKSNATDHYSQALFNAKSKWNKKRDEGYHEPGDNSKSNTILPMLALDYTVRSGDIEFPCYTQPKLDGVRGVFYNNIIYSRKGKEFFGLEHITEALKNFPEILDGELFSKELTFQEIVGIVRKKKFSIKDRETIKKIKFVVYDLVSEVDYTDRNKLLKELIGDGKYPDVILHTTDIAKNKEEIDYYHDKYVSKGNEGVIIRNFKGAYEEKNRSKNLQKFKVFMDSEFEIVGFTEGTGTEQGLVVWECLVPGSENKTFSVRPTGTFEERKKMFKNAKKYLKKMLTVKFFEMTDSGIPRFPIGKTIRDFE
jgi:DNA ligase-1